MSINPKGAGQPMHDEFTVPPPEYRVRPVIRYIVTRYCHPYTSRDNSHGSSGRSEVIGEFVSEQRADEAAHAMARGEPVTNNGPTKVIA